ISQVGEGGNVMLKKYDLTTKEHYELFMEMSHPEVSIYVRNYMDDFNDYLANVPNILEREARGEMIVRVIFNEWNKPVGMITLDDVSEDGGFFATRRGEVDDETAYNLVAKELFLNEVVKEATIQTIF